MEVNVSQSENMRAMLVTFAVLKPLRSSESKESQSANIAHMFVTFEVLKLLKSIVFRDLQPANILLISVTESVLRYLIPVMESSLFIPLNQPKVEVGRAATNVLSNTTWVMPAAPLNQPGLVPIFSK